MLLKKFLCVVAFIGFAGIGIAEDPGAGAPPAAENPVVTPDPAAGGAMEQKEVKPETKPAKKAKHEKKKSKKSKHSK